MSFDCRSRRFINFQGHRLSDFEYRVRPTGSLREYMVHFRYKWLNYYVGMSKTSPCTPMSVSNSVFRVAGRTQWVVLSAAATQNRVKNAHGGTVHGDVISSSSDATAVGGTPAA